jgi:hypothetical protein
MSPEGQISQLQQIAQLQQSRYDAEKAAIKQLYDMATAAQNQFKDDTRTLDVQHFTNPDGSVDNYTVANYWKKQEAIDLEAVKNAHSAQDAQDAYARYRQDVFNNEQAGLAQADPNQRAQWIDNAQKDLQTGLTAYQSDIDKFGKALDDVNDIYNQQVDPALLAFKSQLDSVSGGSGSGGGGGNGGGGGDLPNFANALSDGTTTMQAMSTQITGTTSDFRDLRSAMRGLLDDVAALRSEIRNGSPSGGSGSSFAFRAVAGR